MFEFCPAFWDWLVVSNKKGIVYSIRNVRTEIMQGRDELAEWARNMNAGFFLQPDDGTRAALNKIANWAQSSGYTPDAVHTFFDVADSRLVAQAHAGGHAVVTNEVRQDTKAVIKIPNACYAFGVRCVTPFEMLREEKAVFVLR